MNPRMVLFLRLSVFLIFIGRAYQFIWWNAPMRSIFWDESLLTPIVEGLFNTSWNDYATSPVVDQWIQLFIKGMGVVFGVAAIAALAISSKNKKWLRIPIYVGLGGLILLAIAIVKSKNYDIVQFFELGIQLAAPILLLMTFNPKYTLGNFFTVLKVAIAFTFTAHGLFAMGLIYVPGRFIDMTIKILGVSEDTAVQFLFIVGLLDILLSVMIFIPKVSKYALVYATFWGLVTALARITSGFDPNFIELSLQSQLHETIIRLPHGLIPLIAFLINEKLTKYKTSIT